MKHILFLFLSITFLGCPDDKPPIIVPPTPTNCEYTPGKRSFMWRLDTVAWFPSWLGGVHAFSDSDAWVMGDMHGPVINGQNTSYMGLHWNGKSWNEKIDFLSILMKPNDATGDEHFMVAVGYLMFTGIRPAIAEFDNRTKKWQRYDFEQTPGELRSVWTDGKGYFIAVGDNGMVYTKDGYTAQWVYQKAPTEFNLSRLTGISKNEIYLSGVVNLTTGEHYTQGWKIENSIWKKLYDTQDTTKTPLQLTTIDGPNEIGVWRCNITDSLKLYVIGDQSYIFESKGQELNFRKTNLADLGLPLKANGRTGTRVNVFSPNDIWIIGTRYNFYHWDGINFARMYVANFPQDNSQSSWQLKLIKTKSGKMFFGSTTNNPQEYVVVQLMPL